MPYRIAIPDGSHILVTHCGDYILTNKGCYIQDLANKNSQWLGDSTHDLFLAKDNSTNMCGAVQESKYLTLI